MKHVHTFGCSVFALQNALASGNQLLCWSPGAHLGLNLGPSPMHPRNVYLVLNLITEYVSPQYHCHFGNFFETTHHGAPDVSGTICWQNLASLDRATKVLSKVSAPKQHSIISLEMLSEEESHTRAKPSSSHLHTMSHQMTTASQTENHKSWRTVAHLNRLRLLTQLRESHLLSLLSRLVQSNAEEFAPCHKE